MRLHHESFGGSLLFIQRTAGKPEKPIAGMAVEMVVMGLSRQLVEGSQGGMADLRDASLFKQELDVTVDRGLVEGGHLFATQQEDLIDPQGPVMAAKNAFDRRSLGSLSSHRLYPG